MTPEKVLVVNGMQMAGSSSLASAKDIADTLGRAGASGTTKPWRSVERGSAERFLAAPAGIGHVNMRRVKAADFVAGPRTGLAARHSVKPHSKGAHPAFIQLVAEEVEEADVHV